MSTDYTPEQLAAELIDAATAQVELSKELRLITQALLAAQGKVRELEAEVAELKKAAKIGESIVSGSRPGRFGSPSVLGL